jgi:hypothetical protein
MAKSIKLKDNTFIDSSGVTHNRTNLKTLLTPVLLYEGYITPSSGTVNIGNVSQYERLLVVLGANGSYTSIEIPKIMYGAYHGVNWQAMDNRLANYYVTFKIDANGGVSILYSGYNRVDSASDFEREYGVSRVYGYRY